MKIPSARVTKPVVLQLFKPYFGMPGKPLSAGLNSIRNTRVLYFILYKFDITD